MQANNPLLNFIGLRPTGDFADLTVYTNKRGRIVWFDKSPPDKPPSTRQLHQRQMFRYAAQGWRHLRESNRNDWNTAARRAGLYLSGYLLYLVWIIKPDRPAIRTIERQTGITLLKTGHE